MGKRITLDEIFREREEKIRREVETPEYKAMEARNSAKFKREEEGRLAWEAANPETPFSQGQNAALRGEDRNPPDDLSDDDDTQWLAGWDEERGGDPEV